MKWKEVFTINEEEQSITFTQDGFRCFIHDIEKCEVITSKVQKAVHKEITNSIANALTNSIANGDEYMQVHLRIQLINGEKENLLISKEPVVRFSDTYNEQVRITRKIQQRIKDLRKKGSK